MQHCKSGLTECLSRLTGQKPVRRERTETTSSSPKEDSPVDAIIMDPAVSRDDAPMAAQQTWFAVVVEISTGTELYAGSSDSDAAKCLVPGTCFGSGATLMKARSQAKRRAKGFRAA